MTEADDNSKNWEFWKRNLRDKRKTGQYWIHSLRPGIERLQIYLAYLFFPLCSFPAAHTYPVIFCIFCSWTLLQPGHIPSHYPLNICCSFPTLFKFFFIRKMSMYNWVNLIWIDFFPLKMRCSTWKWKLQLLPLKICKVMNNIDNLEVPCLTS